MLADVRAAVSARPADLALLLLLDFDGTIAEFRADPDLAVLPPSRRDAIDLIARRSGVDVGLVSGRRIDDLRARAGLSSAIYLAGLHGLEIAVERRLWRHPDLERTGPLIEGLAAVLRAAAAAAPGALVEDKGASAAFHVRQVEPASRASALAGADAAAAPWLADGRVRRLEGHAVVEYLPNIGGHKGEALRWIQHDVERRRRRNAWVLYIGDDRTDEDAFRAVTRGIGVRVGRGETAAAHQLVGVAEVEEVLRWLAAYG